MGVSHISHQMDSNLTADSALHSTLHDQERREERGVEKVTQQEARRYGMAERSRNGYIRYTYAGHVFIYDPRTNRAITSWKTSEDRSFEESANPEKKKKVHTSGTRFEKPVLIHPSEEHQSAEVRRSHEDIANMIRTQKSHWKSHTIMVVDMSGSMREDDVNGARCRADGIWTTFAKDFVKQQLESQSCSLYDVVSVVTMQETARVVVECEPMDWVLYNKLVSLREVRKSMIVLQSQAVAQLPTHRIPSVGDHEAGRAWVLLTGSRKDQSPA